MRTFPEERSIVPWLLAIIPTAAVITSTIALVLAAGGNDDLVSDDYYRAGLAVNVDLAAEQRAKTMAVDAQLEATGNAIVVDARQRLPHELRARFVHPTLGRLDRDVALHYDGRRWRGDLATPLEPARWEIRLSDVGGDWRVTTHAHLPGRAALRAGS